MPCSRHTSRTLRSPRNPPSTISSFCLYGWTWDFKLADANATSGCGRDDYGLSRMPGVAAITAVCYGNMQLDGRPVTGWGFTPVHGTIEPEVVAGHPPAGPRQVALGSQTLTALGKTIGDTVQAHAANTTVKYRIVGRRSYNRKLWIAGLFEGAAYLPA
jgi:hypothetical protein